MFKYNNLTFTELVNKIGNSRYWNLPAMLKEVLNKIKTSLDSLTIRVEALEDAPSGGGELPYKVYSALLTQSGTDAPVATVLENTLGDISFIRDDVGRYYISSDGLFTTNKTTYNVIASEQVLGDGFKAAIVFSNGVTGISVNSLPFITFQDTTDNTKDNALVDLSYVEIKVYN